MTLAAGSEASLDVFFPLSRFPIRIEINYSESGVAHRLTIDTAETLGGLHIRDPL